jgi:hypothetical protein
MADKTPKIHQLLAALGEIENEDKKIKDETEQVFGKAKELLDGYNKILVMHDEDRKNEEAGGAEKSEMTTTAMTRLKYMQPFVVRNMDAQLQRECANQLAKSDVTLPDGTVLPDLPVTFLMWMEKECVRMRNLLAKAPTLDTTVRWRVDTDADKEGVRRTVDKVTANKQEMKKVPIELSPATKEHKAQVQLIDEQKIVGHYETERLTGRLTPAEKAAALSYWDTLLKEVKRAKSVANETVVTKVEVGDKVFEGMLSAIRSVK